MERPTSLLQALVLLAVSVAALPYVALPIDAQLPPIAQTLRPYSFQFALNTFAPNPEQLQYTLSRRPPWLNLDSGSRTLSGTPGASDVGTQEIEITASDSTGSVVLHTTVRVTEYATVHVTPGVSPFLSGAGTGPTGVTLSPSASFEFTFNRAVFGSQTNISYYALSADRTPLPAWLHFNGSGLRFFGITPAADQALSRYEVLLIASDVEAREGAEVPFNITLETHRLAFEPTQYAFNVQAGSPFNITSLREHLLLDGSPISNSNLQDVKTNAPEWMDFDRDIIAFEGTSPQNAQNQSFEVNATDRLGDTATATISLAFTNVLITAAGTPTPLHTTLLTPASTIASSASIETTSQPTAGHPDAASHRALDRNGMIAGIVVACVVFCVLMILACILLRRRNRHHTRTNPSKENISRPIFLNEEGRYWSQLYDQDGDVETQEEKNSIRTPTRAPQLAPLSLSPPKPTVNGASPDSTIIEAEAARLFSRASWGYDVGKRHTPHDSMKVPTEIARLSRPIDSAMPTPLGTRFPGHRRSSDTEGSNETFQVRQHVRSEAGIHPESRSSVYSCSSQSFRDFSVAPLSIPSPPPKSPARKSMLLQGPAGVQRNSIRMVPEDLPVIRQDSRSLAEKRQSYIRMRASTRSPFFGTESRASSQSHSRPPLSAFDVNSPILSRQTTRSSFKTIISGSRLRAPSAGPKRPVSRSSKITSPGFFSSRLSGRPKSPEKHRGRQSRLKIFAEGFPRALDVHSPSRSFHSRPARSIRSMTSTSSCSASRPTTSHSRANRYTTPFSYGFRVPESEEDSDYTDTDSEIEMADGAATQYDQFPLPPPPAHQRRSPLAQWHFEFASSSPSPLPRISYIDTAPAHLSQPSEDVTASLTNSGRLSQQRRSKLQAATRLPLSPLLGGNSSTRPRLVEGRGKRPVSVEDGLITLGSMKAVKGGGNASIGDGWDAWHREGREETVLSSERGNTHFL